MDKDKQLMTISIKKLVTRNTIETIDLFLSKIAYEEVEKQKEVIRSLNRQLINTLCKTDRKFAKEAKKALSKNWIETFSEESYNQTICDLTDLCLTNKQNKLIFKQFIIEKQLLLDKKLSELIKIFLNSIKDQEKDIIRHKILKELLFEGIFTCSMRRMQTPKLLYFSKNNRNG